MDVLHRNKGFVLTRIGICQKRADGQQDFGDRQGRRPVFFQDVKTNRTLAVDVAVINASSECDLTTERKRERRDEFRVLCGGAM